ncbi:10729_t:CDS:1 [Ambispora leptoticha]|uniref:10729_t:CDS:1 n=1 Tax=Ambispora leptoticha TaxID=144679 RepID=A0A9N9GVE9_9GLOM|nr:10729_t:CDS:1 [Ambispora leptoticha]
MEFLKSTQIITNTLTPIRVPVKHIGIKEAVKSSYDQQKKIHAFSIDFFKDETSPASTVFAKPVTNHGLASAIIQAYTNHQHLRLTPDDIWLTIAQGLSRHIHYNAQRLRHIFVKHKGKEDIVMDAREILFTNNLDSPIVGDWPKAITLLSDETDKKVEKVDLKKTIECDFTTSNFTSIVASRIILLDTMKEYFTYQALISGCGIPKVTLDGTLGDWLNLQQKVANLRSLGLDLDFWLDHLEPVIAKFVATYKGDVDEAFWSVITSQVPYLSNSLTTGWDGWITAFFPYNRHGWKISKSLVPATLPDGMVNVPFTAKTLFGDKKLEISAGFYGARQDIIENEIVVSPVIGWYVHDP